MNFRDDTLIKISSCRPSVYLIPLSSYLSDAVSSFNAFRYIYQTIIFLYILLFSSLSFALSITIVPNNQVCVVMDKVVDVQTISVEVYEEFTKRLYYVASEDCKKEFQNDKKFRVGYDPVLKMGVSKADAIVGVDKDGNLNYFISWDTLNSFFRNSK